MESYQKMLGRVRSRKKGKTLAFHSSVSIFEKELLSVPKFKSS